MAINGADGEPLALNKGQKPTVIVRAQEIGDNRDEVTFQLRSQGLPRLSWCGRLCPFFQIYRWTDDGHWVSVYQSEPVIASYAPKWSPFALPTRRLCNGEMERPVLFKLWDWNRDAHAVLVAEIKTTLAQLLESRSIPWSRSNAVNSSTNSKVTACGHLLIEEAEIQQKFSFISYLKGGLEMHFMVAIDFTGSNGNPQDPRSLHYSGPPHFESQYMKVIKSVGSVLAPYDADGDIHAYGFGANLDPMGKNVSHCFNLTLNPQAAEVDGIEGLSAAYLRCLDTVQLYGPTYFSEIIDHAAAHSMGVMSLTLCVAFDDAMNPHDLSSTMLFFEVRSIFDCGTWTIFAFLSFQVCSQREQSYNILLIITDGIINDWRRTADAIVNASVLPLSIVIVGVGDANFDAMERLDADDNPLRHSRTGKVMEQCIVKFVPFDEFKNHHISVIAKETLDEIPEQVTHYMAAHKLTPNNLTTVTPK